MLEVYMINVVYSYATAMHSLWLLSRFMTELQNKRPREEQVISLESWRPLRIRI